MSAAPSLSPSDAPSDVPSLVPSGSPSTAPTSAPSVSKAPSSTPTLQPSVSAAPTLVPRGTLENETENPEGVVIARESECGAKMPENTIDSYEQLITYDYLLNIDFGFEIEDILPTVETRLHESLKDEYLQCFPWEANQSFYVHKLDSKPLDTDSGEACTVAERTGSGSCHKLNGSLIAKIFYLPSTRRLQDANSTEEDPEQGITDQNVLDAFSSSIQGFFGSDEILDIPGISESSFTAITNPAIQETSRDRKVGPIVGGTIGGAVALALLCLLVFFGAKMYRNNRRYPRDADGGVYDETYDLDEIQPDNKSLASMGDSRAYVVNDILSVEEDIVPEDNLRDDNWTSTNFVRTNIHKRGTLFGMDSGDLPPADTSGATSPRLENRGYGVDNTVDL